MNDESRLNIYIRNAYREMSTLIAYDDYNISGLSVR